MATPNKSANPLYISSNEDDWGNDEEEQQSLGYNKYDHRNGASSPSVFSVPKYAKYGLVGSLAILLLLTMSGGNDSENVAENVADDINQEAAQVPRSDDITHLAIPARSDDITHLVILGERHSGVPLLESELKKCYPDVQVSSSLERIGIFFQDDPSSQKHNSVVVQLVLNSYDWLEQMRHNPLYMPEHEGENGDPMPWDDFLMKEWFTERPERDLQYKDSTGPVCQMSFRYEQVVSCVEGEGTKGPIYELDEDGEPFASIMRLRSAKLMNHRATKDWETVKDHYIVQYENLTQEYEELLDKIDAATGWEHACDMPKMFPTQSHTDSMSMEFVGHVAANLDWELEGEFGYQKWEAEDAEMYGIKVEGKWDNDGDS